MFAHNPTRLKILLIALISLLVLSTSGFLVWQSIREHDIAVEAASRQLLGSARALAEHAGQSLGEAERALDSFCTDLAQQGGLQRLSEQQLHTMMKLKYAGMVQVGSGLVVNAAGQALANSQEFPIKSLQMADREYFRHHRATPGHQLYLGRPVKSRVLNTWVFTISRRLDNPDGSFAGLAAVSFRVAYFDQFYQSVASRADLQTLLVRTDGWPLAITPNNENAYQTNIAVKKLLGDLIHKMDFGVFRNPKALTDDADRQVAFARLGKPFGELIAVVSLTRDSILSDWQRQVVINVLGALFLMSVSVALTLALLSHIRDLERSETEVRALNERLTLATEAAGIGAWDWDITQDVLHWDAQMHRLYGISPDHKGSGYLLWQSALHPDDRAAAENAIQNALQGLAPFDVEFRITTADTGELRHIKGVARVYRDEDGSPVRMVGINYDITNRKRTEQAVTVALEVAEAANSAKSRFLANVSHEIRTPLNAIVGMTHLLAQGNLSEHQREQLGTVESASRTLLAIINDLLDISRIEAGGMALELVSFNLARLLNEQFAMLSNRAEEKGLVLSYHVASGLPGQLQGDPLRLGQILSNLLSNAVKFTEQGSVTLEICQIGQQDEDLLLCFKVMDTGIGIPPKRLEDIFTPFTQSDNSIARRYGGTGLGLAIASQLVRLMGGEISVSSEENKGSVFSFTIPLRPLHDAQPVATASTAQPDGKLSAAHTRGTTERGSAETAELQTLLAELDQQLARQSMGALNLFRRIKELFAGDSVAELGELETLLDRLEFSDARQPVRRLAEKLGMPYGNGP